MKETGRHSASKNTTAPKPEKKIDYFEIVRNTPADQMPKSVTMGEFREELNRMIAEEKKQK